MCKECQYAVWPDQVKGHLQRKQHRVAIIEASKAGNDVQQWPGVARFPSEFQMPTYVEEPVPEIPLYTGRLEVPIGRPAVSVHMPGHQNHEKTLAVTARMVSPEYARRVRTREGPGSEEEVPRRCKTSVLPAIFPARRAFTIFRSPAARRPPQQHKSMPVRARRRGTVRGSERTNIGS